MFFYLQLMILLTKFTCSLTIFDDLVLLKLFSHGLTSFFSLLIRCQTLYFSIKTMYDICQNFHLLHSYFMLCIYDFFFFLMILLYFNYFISQMFRWTLCFYNYYGNLDLYALHSKADLLFICINFLSYESAKVCIWINFLKVVFKLIKKATLKSSFSQKLIC